MTRSRVGFGYTRGSGVRQSSANAEITTWRPAFESTVAFNAVLTNVEGQPESSRYLLGYNYYRFRTGRVFVGGLADAQRNRDLGISFRASVGAGPGYIFLKSRRQELTVLGGALDLNASVRRELWRDFYIAAALYNSYDNRAPASSTIKNDVGVTLTLGWTF